MKNIFSKIILLLIFSTLVVSCVSEDDNISTTKVNTDLVLLDPQVTSVVIPSENREANSFALTWDDRTGMEGDYQVLLSRTGDFSNPEAVTTTSDQSAEISYDELNNTVLNLGAVPFSATDIYVSILLNGEMSNSFSFTVYPYPVEGAQLESPANGSSYNLNPEMADEDVMTLEWIDYAYLEYNVPVQYKVQFSTESDNFQNPLETAPLQQMSLTLTQSQLNSYAVNAGIDPETTGTLLVRVKSVVTSTLGEEVEFTSNAMMYSVTTYPTTLDLSTTWGVVGSATPNGWDGPDVPFFTTGEEGVIVAYPYLKMGELKFRENNAWDVNYGDDNADGTLEAGGANIVVSQEGYYRIIMNLNDLTYTMEPYSLGIVGSATPNGWDGPDIMLEFDQYSNTFKTVTTLAEGEIKFRLNNAWDLNYGGENGILSENGSNIAVTAGNYIVSVSLADNTYTLEPIDDIWGVVGSATPNGWDGPDLQMTKDWSQPDANIWVINRANLADGEMKFRLNNAWDVNYGSDNADGNLQLNGGNIPVSAGAYKIRFNLDNLTYSVNAL